MEARAGDRKVVSAEEASRIGFEREKRRQEIHPLQLAYKEMQTIMLQIREKDARCGQTAA